MLNILICDDETDIVNALKIYLSMGDYRVLEAHNGQEALAIARGEELHLILLDVMMPVMDGLKTLEELRRFSNAPVILLTAKGEEEDKIEGLNLGADDYITKPFQPMELLARVRSQLRRYTTLGGINRPGGTSYTLGDITLDDEGKSVTVCGEAVSLTPTEFAILRCLMKHAGKVFSSKSLYEAVWQEAPLGSASSIAVHIRHIREKIEVDPSEPRYLKVVWGQGYKMEGGSLR